MIRTPEFEPGYVSQSPTVTRICGCAVACALFASVALFSSGAFAQPADSDLLLSEQDEALQRERDRTAMQARIEDTVGTFGPYDPSLIEMHADLGRLYMAENRFAEAAAAYADALQLTRVADGLYSERQVAILKDLAAAHTAAGSWQNVDNNHHLLFQLRDRLHEPGEPQYALAVVEYAEWKLQAANNNLLRRPPAVLLREMEQTRQLYQAAMSQAPNAAPDPLEISEEMPGDASESDSLEDLTPRLLYGKARAEFEIARNLLRMPLDSFGTPAPRYTERIVCYNAGIEPSGDTAPAPALLPASWEVAQTPPPRPAQVCRVQRIENPNYRREQYEQQRLLVERANRQMRETIITLESVIASTEQEEAAEMEEVGLHRHQLAELTHMHQLLVRDTNRELFRRRM